MPIFKKTSNPFSTKKTIIPDISKTIPELKRPRKRLTELLTKSALQTEPTEKQRKLWNSNSEKSWHLNLLRTPIEIHGNEKVSGVTFGINKLSEDLQTIQSTGNVEFLETGLIFRSIGYKSTPPPNDTEIPFDETKGIIPNEEGYVLDAKQMPIMKI